MRKFLCPGSEWLYFKIYTGIKSADKVLLSMIMPFTNQLICSEIIKCFFFIRYADPDFHIRIRYKLNNLNEYSMFFRLFNSMLLEHENIELIWKIQCDTYQQELERYGYNTMELVESIFFQDSLVIFKIIQLSKNGFYTNLQRNIMALVIIDRYLDFFQFNLNAKSQYCENMSNVFLDELNLNNKINCRQLNALYRNIKKEIYRIIYEIHNISFEDIEKYCKEISVIQKDGFLLVRIEDLISSIIHMSLDRLFIVNNKLNEMVSYYLLAKYYKQEIAIRKFNKRDYDKE